MFFPQVLQPSTAMPPSFPSEAHLSRLRRALIPQPGKHAWQNLTDAERWEYHAYDYGFRRVQFGDRSESYTLDPEGKWYAAHLADQTESMYRAIIAKRMQPDRKPSLNCWEPGYADRYREPWFLELSTAQRQRIMEQDMERNDAWLHGSQDEYMAVCARQVRENLR
jgi:hypothetical protein